MLYEVITPPDHADGRFGIHSVRDERLGDLADALDTHENHLGAGRRGYRLFFAKGKIITSMGWKEAYEGQYDADDEDIQGNDYGDDQKDQSLPQIKKRNNFV